jgi:hypothetical protein
MNKSRDRNDRKDGQHKWYQTSIREMLLVTTLVATILSLLKTVGVQNVWAILCASTPLVLLACRTVSLFLDFRAICKEYDIWDVPDYGPDADRKPVWFHDVSNGRRYRGKPRETLSSQMMGPAAGKTALSDPTTL